MLFSQLENRFSRAQRDRADGGARRLLRRQHLAADIGDVGSSQRSFSATEALYQFITEEISRLRTR